MIELFLRTPRLAGQSYQQLFTDERALTRYHQRETVWLLAFVTVCLGLFGAGSAALSAQGLVRYLQYDAPVLTRVTLDFGLYALAGWTLAVAFGVAALVIRDRAPKALRILRDRPGDVSWAYVVVIVGYPATGVFIGTRQGEREAITMPGQLSCELFLERVAALCPHAVLGHSLAREELFERDPSMGRIPSTAVARAPQA